MSFPQVLTGVAHIGIPTNDLDKTIVFYKKLGFVSALETVNKAAGERVAFLQLGDLMIETYENHRAAEKAGAIDHVALATTDIEAAFAAAKEAGMHLLHSSIQSLPFWENGVRFFMVEGPNKENRVLPEIISIASRGERSAPYELHSRAETAGYEHQSPSDQ